LSMQFEVDDDFQLNSFNGLGLAVTRNSSPSGAWRFGVTLNGITEDGDTSFSSSADSGATLTRFDDIPGLDRYNFGFELLRLHRFKPDRRIGLDLAVGPRIGFFHEKGTENQAIPDLGVATETVTNSDQVYGVVGRFGVEVFLARSLSVHADYGAFAGYRHSNHQVDREESYFDGTSRVVTTEFSVHAWSLSNSGVTLGVSAYF